MAMKFEHKGIVYVHQQKYSVGGLIRGLKLPWDIAEQKDMVDSCRIFIEKRVEKVFRLARIMD